MTNIVAQTGVALERIQVILDADTIIPEKATAITPESLSGNIVFEKSAFRMSEGVPVLHDFNLTIFQGTTDWDLWPNRRR